jgi:hypothetical protein
LVVSGGSFPPFSRVKKFGRAKRSRSFDVAGGVFWVAVSCVSSALPVCADGGEDSFGDVVCWAADVDARRAICRSKTLGRTTNLAKLLFSTN